MHGMQFLFMGASSHLVDRELLTRAFLQDSDEEDRMTLRQRMKMTEQSRGSDDDEDDTMPQQFCGSDEEDTMPLLQRMKMSQDFCGYACTSCPES